MYRACIAIADASRARLFMFERSADAEGLHEQLVEQQVLANPGRRLRPAEMFSDTRAGVGRTGSLQYGLDDHRNEHIDEMDAEFARAVVAAIDEQIAAAPVQRLILCASPRMLGALRDARSGRHDGLAVDEVSRDLVKLSPAQLRERLTSYGLLPAAPPRPALARNS